MSLVIAQATEGIKPIPLIMFGLVLAVTLGITYYASKRTTGTESFFAAGRGISGPQNGLAIAGDYMSAASFLGVSGLMFLYGFDGLIYAVGFLVAFLTVLLLLAERMRNSGKYTLADVLSFRLRERPARSAAALGTLAVAGVYLVAQMVGAGTLFQSLIGINYSVSVVATGVFMLVYVVFGGMIATTYVQIVKAVLLIAATFVLTLFVLSRFSFNPLSIFTEAAAASEEKDAFLQPGNFLDSGIDNVSLGLGLVLGTAGLPHILIRFFTVPDAKAARSSVLWAVSLIGAFYFMITLIGFGAKAILVQDLGAEAATKAVGKGGNLTAPMAAAAVGGGQGTTGGDIFLAVIAAVAFATILAVVAGLVISASGAVAHDIYSNIIRKDQDSEKEELLVGKIAAVGVGVLAILIALPASGINVSFVVGLAFAVAASANFPALLLALSWRRFNTVGAVTGVLVGTISSMGLILLSPKATPGPDSMDGALFPLDNPGIVSIPLGFLGCYLGTILSKEHGNERAFDELYVRSETGLGSEVATGEGVGSGSGSGRPAAAATAAMTQLPK
jgi:cation/acetate symporter